MNIHYLTNGYGRLNAIPNVADSTVAAGLQRTGQECSSVCGAEYLQDTSENQEAECSVSEANNKVRAF